MWSQNTFQADLRVLRRPWNCRLPWSPKIAPWALNGPPVAAFGRSRVAFGGSVGPPWALNVRPRALNRSPGPSMATLGPPMGG